MLHRTTRATRFNRITRTGGFSLVEILLVILIILMLAGALVVYVLPQQESAQKNTTRVKLGQINTALSLYKVNLGTYPTEDEGGLNALLRRPEYEDERRGEPTSELITKNHLGVHHIEDRLRSLGRRVTLEDIIAIVRMGQVTHDSAGYGQVAELRNAEHPELAVLWVAATTPETAPFIPFHIGVTDVPPELKYHRYLSSGQARDAYIDEEVRGLESTRFALRTYKRLRYLMEEHEEKFLPEVTEALVAFEGRLIAEQADVERTALKLFEAGESGLARRYLTYYAGTEALNGMRLGDALANSIEARTKAIYGVRQ